MLNYRPALDGVRAIAAISVVLFHYRPTADPPFVFGSGFLGVDVFFVLSGFLITGALRDRPSLGHFYTRRVLRLVPALAFFLMVYVIVGPLIWPDVSHGRDALLAALYVSDVSRA